MLEPDLGTTLCFVLILVGLLWTVGTPFRYFLSLVVMAGVAVAALAYAAPYRLERLTVVHRSVQARAGFRAADRPGSVRARLRRHLRGRPRRQHLEVQLAAEREHRLRLRGDRRRDRPIGCIVVLLLFMLFAFTGLRISRLSDDPFVRLVAGGATVWICGQAVINVGYVTGLLPVTGIPLPFISAGGTSLLATSLVFGMLVSFARHEPAAAKQAQIAANAGRRGPVQRWCRIPVPKHYVAPKRAGQPRPCRLGPAPAQPVAAGRPAARPRRSAATILADRGRATESRPGAAGPVSAARPPTGSRGAATGTEGRARPMTRVGCRCRGAFGRSHRAGAGRRRRDAAARPGRHDHRLGTVRGLDTRLIPARGYRLELIPPVPLPRKLNSALLRVPARLRAAVRAAEAVLRDVGGRRRRRIRRLRRAAGLPRRPPAARSRSSCTRRTPGPVSPTASGARLTTQRVHRLGRRPAAARPADRHSAASGDREPRSSGAARRRRGPAFGLRAGRAGAARDRRIAGRAGDQPGHRAMPADVAGGRHRGPAHRRTGQRASTTDIEPSTPWPRTWPCRSSTSMERAYAAADFVVCRSGAMTCAELSAVGLPAAYVPLPLRNGEQRRNAEPIVRRRRRAAGRQRAIQRAVGRREPAALPARSGRGWRGCRRRPRESGARDADVVLAERVLEIARQLGTRAGSTPMSRNPTNDHVGDRPVDWVGAGGGAGSQCGHRRRAAARRARAGSHHGHRRVGHERAGPDPDRPRRRGQRLRGPRVGVGGGAARDRRRGQHRPLADAPRRRRFVRLHDRDQPQASRVRGGARVGQAVPAPRGGAGGGARGHVARSRSPARTARRRRPRCSRSPLRRAGSIRRSRSAPRSTRAASTPIWVAAIWPSSRPTKVTVRSC